MDIHQLAPDEPLSPELVLVFPPELRAQALAGLGRPVWSTPRPRVVAPSAPPVDRPFAQSLARMVVARTMQLALIFVVVTTLTLAMSIVANAMR